MKKLLCILLCAAMTAAVLSSCSISEKTSPDPMIRVTSSDAANAAAWLGDRLGEIPQRVVLGTDASSYGIDLSSLEDDGYIIRAAEGETALFARTEDGLDRAVRRYAKAVEAGERMTDETYHEGYRIKRLTIAGIDISEYSVAVYGDNDYLRRRVTEVAAKGFCDLIKVACGSELRLAEGQRQIAFRQTSDPSFKESSYSYRVYGADLFIEYSDLLGAVYGVYALLEDELGWAEISFGDDLLAESDHVDLAEGLSVRVDPMFSNYFQVYDCGYHEKLNMKYTYTAATRAMYDYFGKTEAAGHGLQNLKWGGVDTEFRQICYTDETIRSVVTDALLDYIDAETQLGKKIGDELVNLDIAQGDNFSYCKCKNCIKVYSEEDGAWSGAVVRWANTVAEELEGLGYGGLRYLIYAYHGTNRPCLTKPRPDVFVTLCTDGMCYRHLLDGSQCQWESFNMAGRWGSDVHLNNKDYAGWIKRWGELCDSGNLFVWYYTLNNNIRAYTLIDHIWEDLKFMSENGVAGVFFEGEEFEGFGVNWLQYRMVMPLQLHPDMTKQDYLELVGEVFERAFGDGWRDVYAAVGLWEKAQLEAQNCANCWGYAGISDPAQFDREVYSANWDEMLALLENALYEANSAGQEKAVKRLSLTFLYNGCYAEFFPAYEAGDEETLAKLDERWALLVSRFAEVGLDIRGFRGIGFNPDLSLCETLEETAFTQWIGDRESFFAPGTQLRSIPSEFAEQ